MLNIPVDILGFKGQRVNGIHIEEAQNKLTIKCRRDHRYKVINPVTGKKGTIVQLKTKEIRDVPLLGYETWIEVERAQVRSSNNKRHMEVLLFTDEGCHYTQRLCHLVSGLCRHLSIAAVSRHLGIRWETVKNIDKMWLNKTLPDLDPKALKDLTYIGVDEVARAKGHDYMTVIYDMVNGHLIGVETGRKAEVLIDFLKRVPEAVRGGIKAVAMDMGIPYQKAVREMLPQADIVFDRFHVMKNYSNVIKNQRRIEFRKASKPGRKLIKGSLYLLLKNADKLGSKQQAHLDKLLKDNENLNTMYILKEQLQEIWTISSYEEMQIALETWCETADQTDMTYLKTFAKSLRKHRVGICNYAKHHLTSARIEAGNIAIGMIRKRARGILDTDYFKLKIRQTTVPDNTSMFYAYSH